MVHLLRVLHKSLTDPWFTVFKPFGLPTTTTNEKATLKDLTSSDSVLYRLMLMGKYCTKSQKPDRSEETGSVGKFVDLYHVDNRYCVGIPWNMSKETRGLLLCAHSSPNVYFFRRCAEGLFLRRTYTVLCEANPEDELLTQQNERAGSIARSSNNIKSARFTGSENGSKNPTELATRPCKTAQPRIPLPRRLISGFVLKSHFLMTGKDNSPQRVHRIASLFLAPGCSLAPQHPWLQPIEYLAVIPGCSFGPHKGSKVSFSVRLLASYPCPNGRDESDTNQLGASGSIKMRYMYEIELIEGTEEGMRCLLADKKCPVLNDTVYDIDFAKRMWEKVCSLKNIMEDEQHRVINTFKDFSCDFRGPVEEYLMDLALKPTESNFLHLGLCCTKIDFPDPVIEENIILLKHAQMVRHIEAQHFQHDKISERNSCAETIGWDGNRGVRDQFKRCVVEIPIPKPFRQWSRGVPLSIEAIEEGMRPNPSLLTKFEFPVSQTNHHIDSRNESSVVQAQDTTIASDEQKPTDVSFHEEDMSLSVTALPPAELSLLSETEKENRLTRRRREELLRPCPSCGGFHTQDRCSRVQRSSTSLVEAVRDFASSGENTSSSFTAQAAKRLPFCVICGVRGHFFHVCVHAFSRVCTIPAKRSSEEETQLGKGEGISTTNAERTETIRRCRICGRFDHTESRCVERKAPPWGYSPLGSPLNFHTRNSRARIIREGNVHDEVRRLSTQTLFEQRKHRRDIKTQKRNVDVTSHAPSEEKSWIAQSGRGSGSRREDKGFRALRRNKQKSLYHEIG